jgi:hypothetical protein
MATFAYNSFQNLSTVILQVKSARRLEDHGRLVEADREEEV